MSFKIPIIVSPTAMIHKLTLTKFELTALHTHQRLMNSQSLPPIHDMLHDAFPPLVTRDFRPFYPLRWSNHTPIRQTLKYLVDAPPILPSVMKLKYPLTLQSDTSLEDTNSFGWSRWIKSLFLRKCRQSIANEKLAFKGHQLGGLIRHQ